MLVEIESTGRKVKDAIENGLAQIGKKSTEVDIKIIDNGGLFRKAKVKISYECADPEPKKEPVKPVEPKKEPVIEERKEPEKKEQPAKREERREPERKEPREKSERKEPPKPEKREERREEKREPRREERREERREPRERKPEEKHEPRHYDPVTPELIKTVEDFVCELIEKMGVQAKMNTAVENGELYISFESEASTLIGYHGEVLDSIEYLASYVINRDPDKYYHVIVDCNNYREKRKESLVAHANKMAAKCLKVRHKIILEPMNSNERKIIHSALADNDEIITRSEGHEPNRHVVILCKHR